MTQKYEFEDFVIDVFSDRVSISNIYEYVASFIAIYTYVITVSKNYEFLLS